MDLDVCMYVCLYVSSLKKNLRSYVFVLNMEDVELTIVGPLMLP